MSKTPFVTKAQVEEIVKTYPTPFHIYDEKGIRENARAMNKAFSWNPGFKEYFAVKATPNPTILKVLHEEGCGTDCSSLAELMMSEKCGIVGREIMFSSNDTPPEEFAYAAKLGATINLDDITHIPMLEETCGIPERISCRFNPGGYFEISNAIMDNPGESKYGMTKDQLMEAYSYLAAHGAKEFGMHAFLASNTVTNDYYPTLAGILFSLAVEIKEKTGVSLSFINLSGGIGIPYRPDQPEVDIQAVGEGVRRAYETVCPEGRIAVKSELGRWMTGPCGWLVTRAVHEKKTYRDYIGVDACAADLMRPAMYGAYHHITVCGKRDAEENRTYDITGCLCENNDKFAVQRRMPEIGIGDLLVIHDTGAHGYAMGYNYNGRLRSAEILYTAQGGYRMIRRAETAKDYFATLDIDPAADRLR